MYRFPLLFSALVVAGVAVVATVAVTSAASVTLAGTSATHQQLSPLMLVSAPYVHQTFTALEGGEGAAAGEGGDVAKGEQLFLMNCMACHQKGGVGKIGLAPSIRNKDFLALASDEFITKTVLTGRAMTTMMARPDLKGEKLDHIIAYLRAAYKGPVITDDKKVYKGDAANGAKLFPVFCAPCHGQKGEGYFAGGPGTGIGLKSFLDNASDDFIFQTMKRGRVGTAMKPMIGAAGVANLSEQEAIDIIKHLRALNK